MLVDLGRNGVERFYTYFFIVYVRITLHVLKSNLSVNKFT